MSGDSAWVGSAMGQWNGWPDFPTEPRGGGHADARGRLNAIEGPYVDGPANMLCN